MPFGDIFQPFGHETFGSPFYAVGQYQQMTRAPATKKDLVPFQQENIATNQQQIPVPRLGGERVIAVRWLSPSLDERWKEVDGAGKKG